MNDLRISAPNRSFRASITVLLLTLFIGSVPATLIAQPPVLTLDAGNGFTAELSNYSFTDLGVTNSMYRGTFCFDLKNTSQVAAGESPVYIVGIGLEGIRLQAGSFVLESNTNSNFSSFEIDLFDSTSVSVDLVSAPYVLSADPTAGISGDSSQSFCVTVARSTPFTIDDLLSKFAIVFAQIPEGPPQPLSSFLLQDERHPAAKGKARVNISYLDTVEMCFDVTNLGEKTITGIAFKIFRGGRTYNLLNTEPLDQPGDQHFVFSQYASNKRGKKFRELFDFGMITGRDITNGVTRFGIPTGQVSSNFCVGGFFINIDTTLIAEGTTVRFEDSWSLAFDSTDPSGGVIRGAVASNPR